MASVTDSVLIDGLAVNRAKNDIQPKGELWKDKRFDIRNGYSFWVTAQALRHFLGGFELPKDMSLAECGFALRCAELLEPRTNMVAKHINNYYKPMTALLLADEMHINRRYCQKLVKGLIDKRIMKRHDNRLYMNPLYFIRGRILTYGLYTLFQEDLDAFLPQWVVDRFNGDADA